MGVRGLSRLIGRHETQVSIRLDLSSADSDGRRGVVFDASSLLYYLEARLRCLNPASLHTITGGCLPEFAQIARDFLSSFVSIDCPIWVVFDGIQANAKHSTRIQRRQNVMIRTKSVESAVTKYCSNTRHQMQQLAEINVERLRCTDLSEAVLMEVLRDLNIPVSAAIYEADNECVRLCDEVKALGVVGEDSDYFVFDQQGGYIPLSSLIFDDDGSVYGRLFRVRAIARVLGIPVSFLPVVASLGGNDIVVESSPEMQRLHKTLRNRSSSTTVLDQILLAAKSFHGRRPSEDALAFLKHFIQTSLCDKAMARRLYQIIEAEGVQKYKTQFVVNLSNDTLRRLHCSAHLCCTFAVDIYMNRYISAPFGVGYSDPEDVQFVSSALHGIRQRLCYLIMSDVATQWSIAEAGVGIEFSDIVVAENKGERARSRDQIGNDIDVISKCHDHSLDAAKREQLLQFVLFGNDEQDMWLKDSIFMNVVRYLMITCTDSQPVAAALIRMHQLLQSGHIQQAAASPPRLHIPSFRLCAIFRQALLLTEVANSLLGWPLTGSKLEHCFDGAVFQEQLSSFL